MDSFTKMHMNAVVLAKYSSDEKIPGHVKKQINESIRAHASPHKGWDSKGPNKGVDKALRTIKNKHGISYESLSKEADNQFGQYKDREIRKRSGKKSEKKLSKKSALAIHKDSRLKKASEARRKMIEARREERHTEEGDDLHKSLQSYGNKKHDVEKIKKSELHRDIAMDDVHKHAMKHAVKHAESLGYKGSYKGEHGSWYGKRHAEQEHHLRIANHGSPTHQGPSVVIDPSSRHLPRMDKKSVQRIVEDASAEH